MTAAPSSLVDRELGWLKFNGRVLEEAARNDVSLLTAIAIGKR